MITKSLIAAAAVAATVALGNASTAQADPAIGLSIGFGTPGYMDAGFDGGPDWYWRHHHRHDGWGGGWGGPGYPVYGGGYPSYGLSCGAASNVVRARGFHGVRPVDCSAPVYGFEGWKHGDMFRVSVTTSGRIVGIDPAY